MGNRRKFYKPRSTATKQKISEGVRAYHSRCKQALVLLQQQEGKS